MKINALWKNTDFLRCSLILWKSTCFCITEKLSTRKFKLNQQPGQHQTLQFSFNHFITMQLKAAFHPAEFFFNSFRFNKNLKPRIVMLFSFLSRISSLIIVNPASRNFQKSIMPPLIFPG